jgi:hypothetical protein
VRTSRSPVEHTTSTALYQLAVCGAVARARRVQVSLRVNTDAHQPRLHLVWEASTSCSSLNQKAHACAIDCTAYLSLLCPHNAHAIRVRLF